MDRILVWCAVAFVVSWVVAGAVRRYAMARSMLDIPNERSSHAVPVPRGGGMAIAIVLLGGIAASGTAGLISSSTAVALLGGGVLVGLVGWYDDHRNVKASLRVAVHGVAATWTVVWLGGYEAMDLLGAEIHLGSMGGVLAILGLVWCVNFYNFMDGIDGLAGGEAVCVGTIGGIILWSTGTWGLAAISLFAAAASGGFLVWNWPPAKLFMGDVGSGLLGYFFGALAIASENQEGPPVVLFIILLGVFAFDATTTLIRRVLRGERWYRAHRSHAYQRLAGAGWSHRRVSGAVFFLNLLLGCGAALLVFRSAWWPAVFGFVGLVLIVAYVLVERRRPMSRSA